MSDFLESVNKNLSQLEQLTLNEMKLAQEKMNSCIDFSRVSTTICIIMISATMLICLIYCVTITSHLEQYKENLEQEIEQKNLSITQHNEKMLALQDNIIIGMANLIESRDGDTGEHIKRTSFYVNLLARAIRDKGLYTDILTDNYIELLTKAGRIRNHKRALRSRRQNCQRSVGLYRRKGLYRNRLGYGCTSSRKMEWQRLYKGSRPRGYSSVRTHYGYRRRI